MADSLEKSSAVGVLIQACAAAALGNFCSRCMRRGAERPVLALDQTDTECVCVSGMCVCGCVFVCHYFNFEISIYVAACMSLLQYDLCPNMIKY